LVVDNGSTEKLDGEMVESFGPQFSYHYLKDAPSSPAYALNYGAKQSTGDVLCFMIDGAHILTPGVFKMALGAFAAFDEPVVAVRYFFLGPGEQNETILEGYTKAEEDRLLESIQWPEDGFRLFEIGAPLQGDVPNMTWFNKMIESNCLFFSRSNFEKFGGADERFDIAGGGFLNIDLYRLASEAPGAAPVQLIGEGSFHQLHGGTTTNVSPEERDAKVDSYMAQYRKIRGHDNIVSDKNIFYMGHLPTFHSKIHLKSRKHNQRKKTRKTRDILKSERPDKNE
jgi:glycosyltransferase involved in cell wall biosynthesis